MPSGIESKAFRAAARRNCIKYLGIPIYMDNTPDLIQLSLPTFRSQSSDGAVSQLFSTLVNMNTQIEQIRKGLRMGDAKPVPGVSYNDIGEISMSLGGKVYFEDVYQYNGFIVTIQNHAKNYGWMESVSASTGSAVYQPAKSSLVSQDPVQAAIKGMVMGAISQVMDAGTVLTATDGITEGSEGEKQYYKARDRLEGSNIFNTATIQYYLNTPVGVQNAWGGMGDELTPTLLIDNVARFKANIAYIPTSISITPAAYVIDSANVMYPTECSISIQMINPLGGLLANYSVKKDGKDGAGDDKNMIPYSPIIRDNEVIWLH